MDFLSLILVVLGFFLLSGLAVMVAMFFFGRKLFLSWKKPYRKAIDSLERLSHSSVPFLKEFTNHSLFYEWLRKERKQHQDVLPVLFCLSEERTRERIFLLLPKQEQRKLHVALKQKKSITNEDIEKVTASVQSYMEEEYKHPTKQLDFSFYTLYFYEDYAAALTYIQNYTKSINPALRETIDNIVVSALHSIPYYRERRMYEEKHKFEMFLTKDLPDMLSLISQLPPSQRHEKEAELGVFLKEFQQEAEQAKNSMYSSVENALNVKLRATKEKFYKN
ncbi:DUF3974 domain-containing protein [Bacillus sp. 165]|uniref:DUF3974 domain-containing protein n=1 Tax=Bacillus sp. 165 TaxID=1529117 RepID=UPI001ADB3044|nr:DUF3974 domain-containing protein [Bacillus sp. 165]MBO9131033.1 DUF3974 domain-containing protein [Bacillus sp. 165]